MQPNYNNQPPQYNYPGPTPQPTQPYPSPYPYSGSLKSSTTAGLLGIFLGSAGACDWYLGRKAKAITHVCLLGGGILLYIIADFLLPMFLSYSNVYRLAGLFLVMNIIASVLLIGNSLWGLIDGIIVLAKGDAALAAEGIPVAMPPYPNVPPQPQYPQPYGPVPTNSPANDRADNLANGHMEHPDHPDAPSQSEEQVNER